MSFCDILVAGAGPVGLTAAIEASRGNYKIRIIDKNADSTTKSNAILVNTRTLELLLASGVTQKIIDKGVNANKYQVLSKDYQPHLQVQIAKIANELSHVGKVIIMPQHETENVMIQHLQDTFGIKVDRSTELVEFKQLSNPIKFNNEDYYIKSTVQDHQSNQEVIYSKYLIGADGVHSIVRKSLGIEFQGCQLKRKLTLFDVKAQAPELFHRAFTLLLNPTRDIGLIFIMDMGHNIVRAGCIVDSVEQALQGLPKDLNMKEVVWSSTFQSQARQAETYQKGHVFLAGDAAHCHSPVGGKGMNLGIEDACVLIGLLKQNRADQYNQIRSSDI